MSIPIVTMLYHENFADRKLVYLRYKQEAYYLWSTLIRAFHIPPSWKEDYDVHHFYVQNVQSKGIRIAIHETAMLDVMERYTNMIRWEAAHMKSDSMSESDSETLA